MKMLKRQCKKLLFLAPLRQKRPKKLLNVTKTSDRLHCFFGAALIIWQDGL